MAEERAGGDRTDLHPRRRVFVGAGAAGVAAVLAACQEEPSDPANFEIPDGGNDDRQTPEALVAIADVAIGGGVILGDQDLVVTQPEAGDLKAFSATCTHQGCLVSGIRGDVIYCGCHGSEFSIRDGSVVKEASGVAPGQQAGLPQVAIDVDGDRVIRG